MGYTTEFEGQVEITPPLNAAEVAFINKFSNTRRMHCGQGPYYVDRGGFMGQGETFNGDKNDQIINYNSPPPGQPSLWCQWQATEDGRFIKWDGGEKFYHSEEWMQYLIDHFLKPGAIAREQLAFLQANHFVNGVIHAEGEERDDVWDLVVENNKVTTRTRTFTY